MSETFLWKPVSESDGRLVVLTPASLNNNIQQVYLVGPDGQILDQGKYAGVHNQNRGHFRFPKPGAGYPAGTKTVVITNDGSAVSYDTGNTSGRQEGLRSTKVADPTTISPAFSNIQAQDPGAASTTTVSGAEGDVSFLVPQTNYSGFDIPELPQVQIEDIDQRAIAGQVGEFNIEAQQKGFGIAKGQAKELVDLEIESLRDYITQARQLRQEGAINENEFNRIQTEAANRFNQLERLKAVDVAMPEARDFISEGIERNRQLAQGIIPDTIEDRAFELTSRSIGADVVSAGGFGAGSIIGQKTSELLSAEKRLELSGVGEQRGQSFLRLGMDLNFDQPIKFNPILSTTSEQISGAPTKSAAQLAQEQEREITGLTTISPEGVVGREQQRVMAQAQLDRQADIFNIQSATTEQLTAMNADLFNQQQLATMTNLASDRELANTKFEQALEAGDNATMYKIAATMISKYGGDAVSWFYDYLTEDEMDDLLAEGQGAGWESDYQLDTEFDTGAGLETTTTIDLGTDEDSTLYSDVTDDMGEGDVIITDDGTVLSADEAGF